MDHTQPDLLLERWRRLRRGHRLISFGCSCGMGEAHVSVADFERDLIDYLLAKWTGPAGTAIEPALDSNETGIESLLETLGTLDLPKEMAGAMIGDIEKAINSFARPRRTLRADEA